MKNSEIERRLKEDVEKSVPDVFDSIEARKGTVIPMIQEKPRKRRRTAVLAAMAAALLLVAGGLGIAFQSFQSTLDTVDSIVSLDVNPSIELKVNKDERIIEANARNEDARVILDDMDLKGTDLNVAVNAVVGSMLKHGYITQDSNSILISVENADSEKGAALQKELTAEISGILKASSVEPSVLSQTLEEDKELEDLAETYGISLGKASMIRQIMEKDSRLTAQNLAGLTINELTILSTSHDINLDSISSTGSASSGSYISGEKAQSIALEHAKLSSSAVSKLKTELDADDGVMIYEVEFTYKGTEYEYDINAKTGAIEKTKKEIDDDYDAQKETSSSSASSQGSSSQTSSQGSSSQGSSSQSSSGYIGLEKAKSIALQHAGVSGNVTVLKEKLDTDDGVAVYDIEFYKDGVEYDYEIHAKTGAVLDYDRETKQVSSSNSSSSNNSNSRIDSAKAKEIALKHAGVSASSIKEYQCELDDDDGRLVYEIEFRSGQMEYDYVLNAADGSILEHSRERDD